MLALRLLLVFATATAAHGHHTKPETLKIGEGCHAVALKFDPGVVTRRQVEDAVRLLGFEDWFKGATLDVSVDCDDTAACRDLGETVAAIVKAADLRLHQLAVPPELVAIAERHKREWRYQLWMAQTLSHFCANWDASELKARSEDLGSGLCGNERDVVDDAKGPLEKCQAALAWQGCARDLFDSKFESKLRDDLHEAPFQSFLAKHGIEMKSLAPPGRCPGH
jgi:hypothetical protein